MSGSGSGGVGGGGGECCGDGGDCVGDEWVGAALRAYAGERTLIRPAHRLLRDFG